MKPSEGIEISRDDLAHELMHLPLKDNLDFF